MSMINAANSTSGSSVSCSYCSRDNHIVENFFKKHGYPTNFSNNRGGRASTCGSFGRGSSAGRGNFNNGKVCTYCNITGHIVE